MDRQTLHRFPSDSHGRSLWIARVGILSALSIVLSFLETPLPLLPGFLKLDFSEVPALLATFAFGPVAGFFVELIKNAVHAATASTTGGVGELANMIICGSFVVTAGWIYRRRHTRGGALLALLAGVLVMTVVAMIANYTVLLPFYMNVMGFNMEMIAAASAQAGNACIKDPKTYLTFAIMPFNLFKGLLNLVIVMLIYKRLSPLLHHRGQQSS